MFCPKCKAEYREGFYTCADCHIDLVDSINDEQDSDTDELQFDPDIRFVEILRTDSLADIALIKSILDQANIVYYFQGEIMMHIRYYTSTILRVADYQEEIARGLLQDAALTYAKFMFIKSDY